MFFDSFREMISHGCFIHNCSSTGISNLTDFKDTPEIGTQPFEENRNTKEADKGEDFTFVWIYVKNQSNWTKLRRL